MTLRCEAIVNSLGNKETGLISHVDTTSLASCGSSTPKYQTYLPKDHCDPPFM